MPTFLRLPSGRIIAPAHIGHIFTGADYLLVYMSDGGRIELKLDSFDARALMEFVNSMAVEAVQS